MAVSAWELARHLQNERNKRSSMTDEINFPFLLAIQRPVCFVCKKEVEETLEETKPDGTHVLKVRCHGMIEKMIVKRSDLDAIIQNKIKIDVGFAFMPANMIIEQKKISKED